jgi:hypothetical protein
VYTPEYINRLNNILRLYFNQLDNFTQAVISSDGGKFLSAPYGAFQDTTTQTAVVNTATAMLLDTTDFANEVYISSGTKIRVISSGIYNLQWSGQFVNTDSQIQDVSVWLRQGNDGGTSVDIPGSTGFISVPNKHGGVDGNSIVGWNYFVSLNADDFIEIYWSTTSANVSITAYPAGTGPVRPTTASVVATLSFVSALP